VKGGDEVLKGAVAMQLADPDKFETDILVSEMDISQVELGGDAEVEVDALSGLILPAKVTHIAPTATISSGVVNYKVTVELQSIPTAMPQLPVTSDNATMMPPTGMQGTTAGMGTATGQLMAAVPIDIQLRQGLTVTISLIVTQESDVLLVPNTAITTRGGQSYVQVVLSDDTTEERVINTGATDYVNTEVTEGLSEGEQVLVTKGATTQSTTTIQQRPSDSMMIPGIGGPPGG
jgi:hypothetical protein